MFSLSTLHQLECRIRDDLACLTYPAAPWVPQTDPGVLDVAIIGAGMMGLATAFALRREGIHNIAIFDRSVPGQEGPWATYARMRTLRSAKTANGPDLGIPSLTFRAWFEAQFGPDAWAALGKIPRLLWMDYLNWFRQVLDLPVQNHSTVTALTRDQSLFRLDLVTPDTPQVRYARRIVLATGRDGSGAARIPPVMQGVPKSFWAHSSEAIDFTALAGRRVAVLGGGASAFDNAGTALEHGAATVDMFIRRPFLPQISKPKWMGFPGAKRGFPGLPDHQRWHVVHYCAAHQIPPPRESVQRAAEHSGFRLLPRETWEQVRAEGGGVTVQTASGRYTYDFLILGTGFAMNPAARPELAAVMPHVALWQDRYTPPLAEANPELARHPYLGAHAEFTEKLPGTAPWVGLIHNLTHATILSFGAINGDIPPMAAGVERAVDGLVQSLFREDFGQHYRRLLDLEDLELAGTDYAVPLDTIRACA